MTAWTVLMGTVPSAAYGCRATARRIVGFDRPLLPVHGAPPQFVREVQEHDDLVLLLGGLGGAFGDHHRDALALGGEIPTGPSAGIHHRHGVFGRGVSIVPGRVAKKDIVRFHAVRRLTAWPSRPRRTTAETPGRYRGGWRCSRASSWLHGDQRRTRTSGSRRNTPRANH